jgi:hypothetical protein
MVLLSYLQNSHHRLFQLWKLLQLLLLLKFGRGAAGDAEIASSAAGSCW